MAAPASAKSDFPGVLVSAFDDARAGHDVAGPDLDPYRDPFLLPGEMLGPGAQAVPIVEHGAESRAFTFAPQLVPGLDHFGPLLVAFEDGDDGDVDGRDRGRDHQAGIVGVRHDEPPMRRVVVPHDGLPHVSISPALFWTSRRGATEVLPQIVARSGLQRLAVLHHASMQ